MWVFDLICFSSINKLYLKLCVIQPMMCSRTYVEVERKLLIDTCQIRNFERTKAETEMINIDWVNTLIGIRKLLEKEESETAELSYPENIVSDWLVYSKVFGKPFEINMLHILNYM